MATNYLPGESVEFNNNNNSIKKTPQQNGHVVVDNFVQNGVKPFSGRLRRQEVFKIRSKSSNSIELKDLEASDLETGGNDVTSDRFIRVRSARQSKKLDTSGVTKGEGALGTTVPGPDGASVDSSQGKLIEYCDGFI